MTFYQELKKEEYSMKNNKTMVELDDTEALLFIEFRKHIDIIGYLVGYLQSFSDINNCNVSLDIDKDGIIQHTAITKHFRK